RAEGERPPLGRLGPALPPPDFDAEEAVRRLREPARSATAVGEALIDQRALAGIGNVYKKELLWVERVSPFTTVGDLSDDELARLVATGRRLLLANVRSGRG